MCFLKFDTLRALIPSVLESHTNAAVALERLGNLDGALLIYRQALEISPDRREAIESAMANALQARALRSHSEGESAHVSLLCLVIPTLW